MPTYLTPGVYVEEVPSASKPIEGVGTAVAAFVGMLPGGPANTPMRISNWTQFAKIFGDPQNPDNGPFMEGSYLAHSVYGFFQNGGTLCWVIRVGSDDGAGATPRAALPAATDKNVEALRAMALEGVTDPVTVEISQDPPSSEPSDEGGGGGGGGGGKDADVTYTVIVTAGPEREEYPGVALKKGRTGIATKVNASSKLIKIEETGAALPETRIAPGTYTLSVPPISTESITAGDFEGDVATRKGMGSLAAIDEVTMVVMPDVMTLAVDGDGTQVPDLQGKMIAHCEIAGDRMAILDAPPDLRPQEVLDWRSNTAGYDSKMAALYYPWIEVMNPLTRRPMTLPPSGHIAGVWCRVDSTRGVHKAPANEVILGSNGLAFQVTHAEQGELNRLGINCIRAFPNRGIRIWGARTLSSDPEWRYINVRRIFNYVSESIMVGTQWSVFEPNDARLWSSLTINVWNFLNRVYRTGALFGASPAEAFYVKCDAETNPPEVIEAGQVVCEIGIAPVKPAEFVIFRLSQFTGGGGAEVSE
jgi:phage tail sheath protein FI